MLIVLSVSIFGRGGIRTSNCVYFTRPASVEFPLFLLASQRSTPIRGWPPRRKRKLKVLK